MRGCPLFSASHPLSVGPIRFSLSPFLCMPLLAYRSYSGGTAEVATKTVTSWSNAFDAPNKDQCGLFDVGPPTYDQRGSLDAPEAGHGHEDHGADDCPGPGQGRGAGMTTCPTVTVTPLTRE